MSLSRVLEAVCCHNNHCLFSDMIVSFWEFQKCDFLKKTIKHIKLERIASFCVVHSLQCGVWVSGPNVRLPSKSVPGG